MSLAVVAFVVLALVVGAAIGWLYASREAASAKHRVDALRLQLDEVGRERDANRDAAMRLAALEASHRAAAGMAVGGAT